VANRTWSEPTRRPLPLILIRGFGGLDVEEERRVAYQGFNDGTVYPHKRGENYIYEGMVLRFLKSAWHYQDATNVVGYFGSPVVEPVSIPHELQDLPADFFFGPSAADTPQSTYKVVLDAAMALTIRDQQKTRDANRTLWIFRYYDLNERTFALYGEILVRLIDFIRGLATSTAGTPPKVNIIAHSMGGLIVREAIQRAYPRRNQAADDCINKVVTLGTPHRGISFQLLSHWIGIEAQQELEHFNPEFQKDETQQSSFVNFHKYFDLTRLLTIVGTNYRAYEVTAARWANRLFSVSEEYGPGYNRSDGLVKQAYAQIPGAPRTFVNKCHGGRDSLVTSREAFEIATRFLFGNLRVRLRMISGAVTRGKDFFGKSEFFFGVSIKPRRVDFDLFHQSAEAENCYGPFRQTDENGVIDFSEDDSKLAFSWAGRDRLIWEGYLDTSQVIVDPSVGERDLAFRLDFYVGERDLFGLGFSDNVVFRKQYYVRALIERTPPALYVLTGEDFGTRDAPNGTPLRAIEDGWEFDIGGTGFQGTFGIELASIPEVGFPKPIVPTTGDS
jgi:pimeloyl-ACP methyl ester carboxylesterase